MDIFIKNTQRENSWQSEELIFLKIHDSYIIISQFYSGILSSAFLTPNFFSLEFMHFQLSTLPAIFKLNVFNSYTLMWIASKSFLWLCFFSFPSTFWFTTIFLRPKELSTTLSANREKNYPSFISWHIVRYFCCLPHSESRIPCLNALS